MQMKLTHNVRFSRFSFYYSPHINELPLFQPQYLSHSIHLLNIVSICVPHINKLSPCLYIPFNTFNYLCQSIIPIVPFHLFHSSIHVNHTFSPLNVFTHLVQFQIFKLCLEIYITSYQWDIVMIFKTNLDICVVDSGCQLGKETLIIFSQGVVLDYTIVHTL